MSLFSTPFTGLAPYSLTWEGSYDDKGWPDAGKWYDTRYSRRMRSKYKPHQAERECRRRNANN